MHLLFHFIFNGILAPVVGLSLLEILIVALGGILIDIDHLVHIFFVQRVRTVKGIYKWIIREDSVHRPHFYFFHTLEVVILFAIMSFFLNHYLFLLSMGFLVHYFTDMVGYLIYYRSHLPWSRYLFLTYYLISKPPK